MECPHLTLSLGYFVGSLFALGLPEVYHPRFGDEEIDAVRSVTCPRPVCFWSRSLTLSIHLFIEMFIKGHSLCWATAPMSVSERSTSSVTRTEVHTYQAPLDGGPHGSGRGRPTHVFCCPEVGFHRVARPYK